MNEIQNTNDDRKKRRYEKIQQKTNTEYAQEIEILRVRSDFLPEFEYFLQLLFEPLSAARLQARVGKPLVGLFCIHTPFELFDIFGLHPVKLCGGSHTVQQLAASYLPVLMCPMLKSFMGNFDLQQESFADYKAIVLPTTCDWVVKLPEIMNQKTDNAHYLELPHLKETEKSQNRWLEEILGLKELLEKITGKKLKAKLLKESINKYMDLWALLEELTKLKRLGKLSGVWYTAITNTFMLDNMDVWAEKVKLAIKKLLEQPADSNAAKIFVAGSPIIFPNLKLLQLIEQAGMNVAADDICSSERIMPGGIIYNDTSEYGMLRAIAERYHKACVCPTFADNDRRVNSIVSTSLENNIKGVIFNLLKGCHPYDIEAITIERKLKEKDLKFLKIETDYGKEDSQNILTRLEAFKQTL
ncbi:MAG: 2-hydroxyacyl-CoA dehydratase family protein [Elusimicrobiota bacterium]|jgi:benzoyl-CoA reductase/2-hydroxyglutaryl-CoA dehydratase subunit BcrC/BadD/HgdB|nr:2-hydroxyacyl-CoA dehydratase family protein [Elusimicrobiota bacterium]